VGRVHEVRDLKCDIQVLVPLTESCGTLISMKQARNPHNIVIGKSGEEKTTQKI
jgi:hypothetical protein